MGDFGPTTTTTNFEPFNSDIFKDAKMQQELNDSKDSDEGFSSSFSPTSESSMIQGEAISTSLHLWGTEKDDQYFVNSLAPVSSNASFLTQQSARRVVPSSSIQTVKKPSPALSTYLAANKAAAHSLGVSSGNWNQPTQPINTSSWPMNPNPIGTTNVNWNGNAVKNGIHTNSMHHVNNSQQIAYQIQQQKNFVSKTNGHSNGGNHPFPPNLIQAKNMKSTIRGFPNSHVPYSAGNVNNLSQANTGAIDSVDDIGHLTNSFSSLSTSSDHSHPNMHVPNGYPQVYLHMLRVRGKNTYNLSYKIKKFMSEFLFPFFLLLYFILLYFDVTEIVKAKLLSKAGAVNFFFIVQYVKVEYE